MEVYFVVAAGAALAGFVQGLSGFAFGLVAMSVWIWVLDPKLAAALTVFGGLVGQVVAAISVRRPFSMSLVAPFLAGGLVGVPIGVGLLPLVDASMFKAGLGVFLIAWCSIMLLSHRMTKIKRGGHIADVAVGLAGGILGGFGGFTGVIPTLWCVLRGYARDDQRAIIQNFNLSMLIVIMGFYVSSGLITRDMLPMFAIVAPAMLIPTLIGTKVYLGVSDLLFRRIVLGLLTLSGVAMLSASLPSLF